MGLVLGCMSPVLLIFGLFVVLVLLNFSPAILAMLFIVSWSYCTYRFIRWVVTS